MTAAIFRLRIMRDDPSPMSDSYRFERAAFEREYGVTPAEHDAEFAPYRDRSVFASVTDRHGQVVGHMRLILPAPDPADRPIKTFVEAALPPWDLDVPRAVRLCGIDPERTWDVATLAVDRALGRQRTTVHGALCHALVQLAERNRVQTLVMTVDERVRSTLRMIGLPTDALPGARPQPFCGSRASTPAWGNCVDMLAHQRVHNPEAHRLIKLGGGLSDVELPAADAYLLDGRGQANSRHHGSIVRASRAPRNRRLAAVDSEAIR